MSNPETVFIDCACAEMGHTVRFNRYGYQPGEGESDVELCSSHYLMKEPMLFMDIHIAHAGLFRRVWQAIRHVIGWRSQYGEFTEVLWNRESAIRVRDMLTRFVEDCDRAYASGEYVEATL